MVNRFHKYKLPKKNDPKSAHEIFRRLFFFVFGIAMSGSMCLAVNDSQLGLENYLYAKISEPTENIILAKAVKEENPGLDLEAKAAYSLRIGTGGREKIIYRRNEDEVYPIASLTKLMAATVIFENPDYYDFDRQVTVSDEAAAQYDVPVFGNLNAGETYTVSQLLNLMLFYSSNDAAYALAEVMGTNQFVAAMNSKAADLGLVGAEFYNPHGLDLENGSTNHASAADLMILAKYILNNHPQIFDYSIKPGPYMTENGIFSLNFWDGNSLIGGKTGFTEKAGGCMVVVFKDDAGRRYINVILGASTPESRVNQMQKLINYANNSAQTLAQKSK